MPFKVLVDDNFHYMDESERYELGVFPTLEAATEAARLIVDEYLQSSYQPGMTSDGLLTSYVTFGEDPFIVSTEPDSRGVLFSARDYARTRCDDMCRQIAISPEWLSEQAARRQRHSDPQD